MFRARTVLTLSENFQGILGVLGVLLTPQPGPADSSRDFLRPFLRPFMIPEHGE
jgi:hypothetical protein